MKLVNIGFGNVVNAEKIVSILSPESAPVKRMITQFKELGNLIDATYGRRTRSVIVTDSSFIILSMLQPETISARLDKEYCD